MTSHCHYLFEALAAGYNSRLLAQPPYIINGGNWEQILEDCRDQSGDGDDRGDIGDVNEDSGERDGEELGAGAICANQREVQREKEASWLGQYDTKLLNSEFLPAYSQLTWRIKQICPAYLTLITMDLQKDPAANLLHCSGLWGEQFSRDADSNEIIMTRISAGDGATNEFFYRMVA